MAWQTGPNNAGSVWGEHMSDISGYQAVRIDATCNYMNVELGVNSHEIDNHIGTDKGTAFGRYIRYVVARDTIHKAGSMDGIFLGIIPVQTGTYLINLMRLMGEGQWRWCNAAEFRKFLTYVRREEKIPIEKADTAFPLVEKWFETYANIKRVEKLVK